MLEERSSPIFEGNQGDWGVSYKAIRFFDVAQKAVKKIFKKVLARISISCILAFAAEARGVSSVG